MQNTFTYFTRLQSARGRFGSLPPLARSVVGLFAIPGIVLLVLSILLAFVSISILLLLTVPVYGALRAVFGGREPIAGSATAENPLVSFFGQVSGNEAVDSPGRKQVEARVVDAD